MWMYALLVFIGGCSLGALSTSVKLAYSAGFNLSQITISQFLIGTILLWILVIFTKRRRMSLKYTGMLLLCGIPMSLTGVFYYFSLQTLDASLAIIFLFQFVWIGALFDYILYRKVPSKLQWASIAILLAGSLLATAVVTNGFGNFTVTGVIFGLLAAFTFTSFLFISGNVGKELPPLQKSALIATGGLLFVSVLYPPFMAFDHVTQMISFAPYGIFLGVFGVTLPPLLFAIGMPKVGTGLGTILSAAELPIAVILSSAILLEYVSPIQWTGVIVVLLGVAIGNVNISKRETWQVQKVS